MPQKTTILRKFLLNFLLIFLLIFVFLFFAFSWIMKDLFFHQIKDQGELVSQVLGKAIETSSLRNEYPFQILETLKAEIGPEKEPHLLFYWLVDEKGKIQLADNPELIGQEVSLIFPKGKTKISESFDPQTKQKVVITVEPVKVFQRNWFLYLGFSEKTYLKAQTSLLFNLARVFLLTLFLAILFFFFQTRRLTSPLKDLSAWAKDLSRGKFGKKLEIKTGDEVQALAESLNQMASELKKLYQNLEGEVREKTKELFQSNLRLQEALKTSASLYSKIKTILEVSPLPIILLDHKRLTLIFANQKAREVFSLSEKEIGENLISFFPFLKDFKEMSQTQEICQANFEFENRFYLVLGKVLSPEDCLLIFWDLTKEHELDRQKTEFVSVTAHELRTPANALKWAIELLKAKETGKLNKLQADLVENIYQANLQLLDLVEDLLNVTRLEEKRIVLKPEKIDFLALAQEVAKLFLPEAQKKGLAFEIKKPETPLPLVWADSTRVKQILSNLLSNAFKFTEKGKVTLEIGPFPENPQKYLLVKVQDTGLGIPKAEQKRVFERFFRSSLSEAKNLPGTGLGLYIVKQLIELQQGKIWFESEEGKGTTFYFTLPFASKEKNAIVEN